MEASALTHASRSGLIARRSPLLKLQGDEKLVALVREGNPGAFDAIVDRYQPRLQGFCRQMLRSKEDAEDVLQEVFVNAYRAMLADSREINLRPWLYRIARNRCLNHIRKPSAEPVEKIETHPIPDGAVTHQLVQNREEFRQLLLDVNKLPETQRSALMLREMDALSYEDIAVAMDTTVPSVKSLLVRARISLAEASQARLLTCGEVRLELAEAAEGLRKASGPMRRHVRECDECSEFRDQLRSDTKALAALTPIAPLIAFKSFLASKLGLGGGAGTASAAGTGGGASAAGSIGAGSLSAGVVSGGAAGGLSAVGSAIGAKAVVGVVTAAVITAGAVEVKNQVVTEHPSHHAAAQTRIVNNLSSAPPATAAAPAAAPISAPHQTAPLSEPPAPPVDPTATDPAPVVPAPAPAATDPVPSVPANPSATDPTLAPGPGQTVTDPAADGTDATAGSSSDGGDSTLTDGTGGPGSGDTAVVTIGDPVPVPPTTDPGPVVTPPVTPGDATDPGPVVTPPVTPDDDVTLPGSAPPAAG